jgi:ankyrin repeat protein
MHCGIDASMFCVLPVHMLSNWSAHADTQHQVAAARQLLRAGGLQRYALGMVMAKTLRNCVVSGLLLVFIMKCQAEPIVDGRTASQTFDDPRVAELMLAVNERKYASADSILKGGADINAPGYKGVTPLLWIMGTTRDVQKIEYMLKAGGDPNYRDPFHHASAMFLASGGDRPDILELLLKYKGDPNLPGPREETMLRIALGQVREKNFELLIKYGADINHIDRHGDSAADDAATFGRFDLVARLLDMGLRQDFQGLAKTIDICSVQPGSEQARWKEKVIEMLKARGAKFPAFIPHKVE